MSPHLLFDGWARTLESPESLTGALPDLQLHHVHILMPHSVHICTGIDSDDSANQNYIIVCRLPRLIVSDKILEHVAAYYSQKLRDHGTTPQGVDWRDEASQCLRFEQLARIFPRNVRFSVIDVGCGYGAFRQYLDMNGWAADFIGFDISHAMIEASRSQFGERNDCKFVSKLTDLPVADYAVASGIFNVRLQHDIKEWEDYVFDQIHLLDRQSLRGFAFNMLTKYSDPDKMRGDLFYGDPCFYFDYCKKQFSRDIALLHDYGLWEFTILVRKGLG